jgi:glycyl-tRNA synthetase beta chain
VADEQEDVERDVVGPPARVAFAEDGTPTKAATGFAESQGVNVADLDVRDTGKGDYVHVHVVDHGSPSFEVLPELLRAAADSVSFPKTMRWGTGNRFARPVRWLVAMLDGVTLDMEYAGIHAQPETWGHRHWSPGPHPLAGAGDYLDVLEKNYVIADVEMRRSLIIGAAEKAAEECGGLLVRNDALLDEVTFLVEYPSVFAGRFDEGFLDLPREVIVVAMKSHQRYFAVEAEDGSLRPFFLCVANVPRGQLDGIRAGNERVLVSRLDDAAFYWKEDTRGSLESKVEALRNVTWLEGLGSLYEKTDRLERLARAIGERLDSKETDLAVRAARLAKADLVTEMVRDGKEFTELQGIMGREYALASDEPVGVATAIYEHYLPRFAGDLLPSTEAGTIFCARDSGRGSGSAARRSCTGG